MEEQNFTISRVQPCGENRHAVFFTYPREMINYHYERQLVPVVHGEIVDEATAASNPDTEWRPDPRIQHTLTLEADSYGNVLKEAAIGYGRRHRDSSLPLPVDQDKQAKTLTTYIENRVTNQIDEVAAHSGDYRTPLSCEARTYELTGCDFSWNEDPV